MDHALAEAIEDRLLTMSADRVVERIWAIDHTVWSDSPTEIADRLGWLTVWKETLTQVADLKQLAASVQEFDTVVLMGMGGSSLAPEVLYESLSERRVRLFVLDSTNPRQITAAEAQLDLTRTLFIVSSKSGSTIETRSQMEYFWAKQPHGEQFIAVTDPGSQLEQIGHDRGFRRVFLNDPNIGGRYSALSYFGMAPAALTGVDVTPLLDGAAPMADSCTNTPHQNPGALLGVTMGEAAIAGRDKLTLVLPGEIEMLGHWIEQLIAESTGKEGKGILPVEAERLGALDAYGTDRLFVAYGEHEGLEALEEAGHPVLRIPYSGPESLGAEFFRWEFATAVACHVLEVNPFDQPNVQEAKDATNEVLGGRPVDTTTEPLEEVLGAVEPSDYIAILAWLPRSREMASRLERTRHALRDRYRVATTIGFGPRFLHSTGQLHKGGPNTGVFIQVIDESDGDLAIPGADYSFARLQEAQALGDLAALKHHRRRVARVSLQDLEIFAGTARK